MTNAKKNDDTYFALLEGDDLGNVCVERFKGNISFLKKSGQWDRMRRSWRMNYGRDGNATGTADNTRVQEGGRQGEQTLLKPNRWRARMQRVLNMNAGPAPAFQPIALNTDAATTRGTQLASHIIEYYGSAKKLYERLLERDEAAFVFSEAYIVDLWDYNKGNVYTYEEHPELDSNGEPILVDAEGDEADSATAMHPEGTGPTGQPDESEGTHEAAAEAIDANAEASELPPTAAPAAPRKVPKTRKVPVKDGDFRTMILTPLDCMIEPYTEDRDEPNWSIFRYCVNKFDLAVQYPAMAEKILAQQPWDKARADIDWLVGTQHENIAEAIELYAFFHVNTMSVPGGRQAFFLGTGELLGMPQALEYKRLPVFRTAPGDIMLSTGGWSPGFDLLPVCQTQQAHISIGVSNMTGFGLQSVVGTKGNGVQHRMLGGLNYFEINPGHKLEGMNHVAMPENYFDLWEMLVEEENNIAGTNAAANGQQQGDSSGSNNALLVSAAQQMQTRFQRSRMLADSLLFTHKIDTLKSHAKTERMIEIGGKTSAFAAKTFTGADLNGVSRIVVKPTDPARDTPQGREAFADKLVQMQLVRTPMDYVLVRETGRVDHIDDPVMALETLIKQENELLSDPDNYDPATGAPKTPVLCALTDRHSVHITKHARLLDSPEARNDPAFLQRVIEHITEHVNVLKTADPALLQLIGEQSLAPQPAIDPATGQPAQPQQHAGPHGTPSASADKKPGALPGMPTMPHNPLTGVQPMQQPPNQLQAMTPQ